MLINCVHLYIADAIDLIDTFVPAFRLHSTTTNIYHTAVKFLQRIIGVLAEEKQHDSVIHKLHENRRQRYSGSLFFRRKFCQIPRRNFWNSTALLFPNTLHTTASRSCYILSDTICSWIHCGLPSSLHSAYPFSFWILAWILVVDRHQGWKISWHFWKYRIFSIFSIYIGYLRHYHFTALDWVMSTERLTVCLSCIFQNGATENNNNSNAALCTTCTVR